MDIISCSSGVRIVRPTVNFPPSYWGDRFISCSSPLPSTILENPNPRIEELKKEVKAMFERSDELTEILRLIDDLQRLGVAYHFEEEINESLRRIHEDEEESNELHIVALRFRLLRQKCYNVPSGDYQ